MSEKNKIEYVNSVITVFTEAGGTEYLENHPNRAVFTLSKELAEKILFAADLCEKHGFNRIDVEDFYSVSYFSDDDEIDMRIDFSPLEVSANSFFVRSFEKHTNEFMETECMPIKDLKAFLGA